MTNEQIECLLAKQGLKKFYTIFQTATGSVFEFDNDFIIALDNYFLGNTQTMTKSQYKNIKLFLEYADEQTNSTHLDFNALKELDNFLTTIGVE